MAQRNQLGGALRRLNAGESCEPEHVALPDAAGIDQLRRLDIHIDDAARNRDSRGLRLRADVDHVRDASIVEMRERLRRRILRERPNVDRASEALLAHSTVTDLARLRGWST